MVLNDYLREFRTKLTSHKNHLEAVSISASSSQGEKTKALKEIEKITKMIAEMEEYEREVLYPLATEQLEIDLDDGVKVNYLQTRRGFEKDCRPGCEIVSMKREETGNHKLESLLHKLIQEWESEVVEFKRAGKDYSTDRIGEYFSALANEANLRGLEKAWLIFGVNNQTRTVVGSDYRQEPGRLQGTKNADGGKHRTQCHLPEYS